MEMLLLAVVAGRYYPNPVFAIHRPVVQSIHSTNYFRPFSHPVPRITAAAPSRTNAYLVEPIVEVAGRRFPCRPQQACTREPPCLPNLVYPKVVLNYVIRIFESWRNVLRRTDRRQQRCSRTGLHSAVDAVHDEPSNGALREHLLPRP